MLGVALIHKHAHDNKRGVRERNEENTPGRVIQNNGERKAKSICCLNRIKLPFFLLAVGKKESARKVCEIEERATVCAYKQEIEEEHKASRSLHNKEITVSFALERPDDYNKTDDTERLRYDLGLVHFGNGAK